MKKVLVILGLLTGFFGAANTADSLRVRLYSDKNVSSVKIRVKAGHYVWIALSSDGNVMDTVSDASGSRAWLHDVRPNSDEVVLNRAGRSLGRYPVLRMVPLCDSAWYLIDGPGRDRVYTGGLEFRYLNGKLLVIGLINLPDYIAGVVESEGGHSTEFEYFKAQAVLARTWLLANMNKHSHEGYNVKDDVSSQVYFGMAHLQNSPSIRAAVEATKDTILVDENGHPILGVFHANSGGITANSEDAWSGYVSYLRSVPDTFSLDGSQAFWEKELDKEAFLRYVAQKMEVSSGDPNFRLTLLEYRNPTREGYFRYQSKQFKWRDARTHFGLRSTWFNIEESGDKVILHGRGYGHGVGMSQEGAMIMSSRGYNYREILQFYFSGTELVRID